MNVLYQLQKITLNVRNTDSMLWSSSSLLHIWMRDFLGETTWLILPAHSRNVEECRKMRGCKRGFITNRGRIEVHHITTIFHLWILPRYNWNKAGRKKSERKMFDLRNEWLHVRNEWLQTCQIHLTNLLLSSCLPSACLVIFFPSSLSFAVAEKGKSASTTGIFFSV